MLCQKPTYGILAKFYHVLHETFFAQKSLVVVLIEEGSGSIRHEVTGISATESKLHIYIARIVPEEGTCDMAAWHIIVSADKDDLPMNNDKIEIHYNEDKPKTVSVRAK